MAKINNTAYSLYACHLYVYLRRQWSLLIPLVIFTLSTGWLPVGLSMWGLCQKAKPVEVEVAKNIFPFPLQIHKMTRLKIGNLNIP